jgi:hypothetical protein
MPIVKGLSKQKPANGKIGPRPSRPYVPGYGIPTGKKGMLPWRHVSERMGKALNYWMGTTDSDGRPHATPVWGAWLDETLYFDGSPQTRRGRNLAANPAIVVHLESGSEVVIVQGEAHQIRATDQAFATRLAAAYAAKYTAFNYAPSPDTWKSGGLYVVRPRVVFAWTKFPKDATRWNFEG